MSSSNTAFKLNITRSAKTEGSSTQSEVDWDAYNEYIVAACATATKARSLPGFISGIYDLGEQNRPDYEEEFKGDEDAEMAEIAKDSSVYFKTVGGKRYRCRPMKPVQQVAVAIDFPQIMVDKGQFFGNEPNPAPLRMLLNGEFYIDGERVVGKPCSISETKHENGRWAFAKNNKLHVLAAACGLLDDDGLFTKERTGELLGQVAQFEFRVWMKPSKTDASKKYLTENIKVAGMVPEGVPIPEFDSKYLHAVNVYEPEGVPNNPDHVKQLRLSVKNTIKRANNYQGSDIQRMLEGGAQTEPSKPASVVTMESKRRPSRANKHQVSDSPPPGFDDDDDAPF